MKISFILAFLFSSSSYAGWSIFHNKPKGEAPFIGQCMDAGTFAKFSSVMLNSENCKINQEKPFMINCASQESSSDSYWFETREECLLARKKLSETSDSKKTEKSSAKSGWIFFKLKSSQIHEGFKPCEKVKFDFDGYLNDESKTWSGRGAVCKKSFFYEDNFNVFTCKYPSLGNTERYYFWHDTKITCEQRQKLVKERWKKEKLD